ncbi:hypothetical protein Flavo103_43750 [Flavobacterium collinsii]|uniref:RBBP9/YdeN family alpha/beta hydrolase n=1 Tax=Flavobacterium collinsii TaxID=1114861 RepID=UPI0022C89E99|nr:alpha/beta hydrolase [Flavobacterium collinsii]GIQ61240.1 hypothetical protein Flavo103_43750 [Flavobacterium collinsii]
MKKVIIIHGFKGNPEEGWKPWLKKELESQGYKVLVPPMPNSERPKLNEWLCSLGQTIGMPNEDTYMVGHSLGCITIIRYLEGLSDEAKIGGAVFVGGFTSNIGLEEFENFFKTDIDWKKVKQKSNSFTAIHSTNDPYVSLDHSNSFKEKLKAETIIEEDKGHFFGDDGVTELPSVLKAIVSK